VKGAAPVPDQKRLQQEDRNCVPITKRASRSIQEISDSEEDSDFVVFSVHSEISDDEDAECCSALVSTQKISQWEQ
jgi:hypothetical protein